MTEEKNLKTAIVTGGGTGLGMAISRKLAEAGYRTIIISRDAARLDAAAESIGPNCISIPADLSDLKSIPALVERISKEYGHIHVLVNNAGINMKKLITDVSDEDFQQVMTVNVSAVFSMSREVIKNMKENGGGSIINISSMAALYGLPKVIAYSASKSAITGMTRAMAVELAEFKIRVNAIAPGFIYSDMTAKALDADPERKAKVFGRTPMGIMGQPEDIGAAAAFLASEDASFITGVCLPVDGGNSIGF